MVYSRLCRIKNVNLLGSALTLPIFQYILSHMNTVNKKKPDIIIVEDDGYCD